MQDIPHHVGGIWDSYKPMDATESRKSSGKNRKSSQVPFRNQTEIITGRLTADNPDLFPEYDSGSFERDFESFSCSTEISVLQYTHLHKEKAASGYISVGFDGYEEFFDRKNQLILPPVERKISPPVLKGEKSDDKDGIERLKRYNTTFSGAKNFILPASKDALTDNTQRFIDKSLDLMIPPRNPTVPIVKKDTISNDQDEFYLGILEGSQSNCSKKFNSDDEVKSGTKKMAQTEKLYEEEIYTLKKVCSIFESIGNELSEPRKNKVSYKKEIEKLQRICSILRDFAAFNCSGSGEINAGNLKKQDSCLQTEAVSGEAVNSLLKTENQYPQSKTNDISLAELNSGSKDVAVSFNSLEISEQNIAIKMQESSLPLWRQSCANLTRKKQVNSLIKSHVERLEPPIVIAEPKHGATIESGEISSCVSQNITIKDQIMNGILPMKISGSHQAIKAFNGATFWPEKSTTSSISMDTTLPTESVDVMPTAKKTQSSSNANDATLQPSPFKPRAALLSPKTLCVIPPSESIGELSSAMDAISLSNPVVRRVPSGFKNSSHSLKSNEVDPEEDIPKKYLPRNYRGYEIAPRFAAQYHCDEVKKQCKTESSSPEDPKRPLKINKVSQGRSEISLSYGLTAQRRIYNEQMNSEGKLEQWPLPWKAAHQEGHKGSQVGPTSENVFQRSEKDLPCRVGDKAPVSRNSYDGRQHERAKSSSLQTETALEKSNNVGRCSVGDWRSKSEKITRISNSIKKSNDLNMKQEEDALLNGSARKPISDFSVVKASDVVSAMVVLKVFEEEKEVDEMTILRIDLVLITRRYKELIPPIDAQHLVLEYNADAVAVFLRYVCLLPFKLLSWKIALEVFALAQKYNEQALQEKCTYFFDSNSINVKEVKYVLFLAKKFQITKVLKTFPMFAKVQAVYISDSDMLSLCKKSNCSISCTTFIEPSELDIPLHYVGYKTLEGCKTFDIENKIIFEGISGTFVSQDSKSNWNWEITKKNSNYFMMFT